uniref:G-protein coupled receptors family 2 profile 2 domain-containing protein n=1 Tax=Aplanochytrium stocchinoi TaxID=215587 RepID=A0A7S3PND0_9STRA|mmetsp:Transcript_19799/g.24011  ORF Transcript_19799/g.24011 Transcript_19799/m.24011 type:complete len:330 (+) Transcript_19799:239-1228(+)|eukprot:CAMPEP_0204837280 /NCGR_PEP_ID=MMETSP1346-20131115/27333_1 /ASSEMBLY_ACC=CAM_ASM_000771 /TAXON_ID=215587 /ORGANISM="Aplanochytrium stocchinoi, Strain GSBS06" /LENGTH=329 /DNA_ID=CAMNT_0051972593 /DNA_START=424 /DNA_END=1413 /DNA_ORIENTATION=+
MNILSEASFTQKQIYWWSATFLLWVAFGLMAYAMYEWQHNKAYHKDMFKGFIPMFMGNVGFVVAYLPYHTYNAFSSAIEGESFQIAEGGGICYIGTFFNNVFMCYSWFGMTMVAYALHETVRRAMKSMNRGKIMTRNVLLGSFVLPLILTVGYFFVDFDNIGPYRGLYCLWTFWHGPNFGYGIVWWGINLIFLAFFYYNTYKMLHGHFAKMGDTVANNAGKATLNNMIILSIKFVGIFVACGSPVLLEIVWAVAGGSPPVQLSMLGGLTLKLKCALDPLVILTMPAIKDERSAVRKATLDRLTLTNDGTGENSTSGRISKKTGPASSTV